MSLNIQISGNDQYFNSKNNDVQLLNKAKRSELHFYLVRDDGWI